MSVFSDLVIGGNGTQPDPPSKRIQAVAKQVREHSRGTLLALIQNLNNGMRAFWMQVSEHQKLADELGVDLVDVMSEHAAMVQFLTSRYPFLTLVEVGKGNADKGELELPPAWAELAFDGGKVTITEKAV